MGYLLDLPTNPVTVEVCRDPQTLKCNPGGDCFPGGVDPRYLLHPLKFNSSPLESYHHKKERIVFQPSILRGNLAVKLHECKDSAIQRSKRIDILIPM